ncbi:MAG: TolC family outer membrane protein [Rhodospirillum sp.]|nr:TolC family outer membrane protein [Rhodospirillum sp.]MCF8492084.1 TolC family outer membrane protein [Rhodospirillum sp.]MCF8502826.1 TolC family outer membrane protein [Rhodospirillum sp.]
MMKSFSTTPVSKAVAALMFAGVGLTAAPSFAETFEEALISAYQGNPTIAARRAVLRAVDEQVPQALSNWRPQVSIQGSAFYENKDNYPGEKNASTVPATVGIVLDQNIFRGFRTQAETDIAEATIKAERATLHAAEQTVLLNAARAYFNVIQNQAVLELNTNNEDVLNRQQQAAEDRFRVGEITRTDVAQAESRRAGAISDRIGSEGDLETARASYEQVVGHPPVNLVAPALYGKLPLTLDDAIAEALTRNPDIVNALYAWDAAQATIRDEKGKLLPTVTAESSYIWAHEPSVANLDTTTFKVGLNVSVPLYQSGAIYSQIRDAKHRAGQRRLQVDEQRDAIVQGVTTAWQSLQSANARVISYNSQIEAATIALEGVQREAQVGSRTTLDVLDAEQELLTSRVNLVRAQRDAAINTYELLNAMGRMTARDLELDTPIYDPVKHYEDVRGQWIGGNDWANTDAAMSPETPISNDFIMNETDDKAIEAPAKAHYVVAPGTTEEGASPSE